jgi:PAS domain S-box-containing protein
MLEHIPNAFYALDRNMNFIYANNQVLRLMRKTEDEITGKNIWDIFSHNIDTPMYEVLNDTLRSGNTGHLEYYFKPYDKWFEVYAYPSDYGLAVYINDISDRKKVETHLQILNKSGEYLALTHDMDEALTKISKLIVPDYADWFTVDWLNVETNTVQLLKLSHHNAEKEAWAINYRNNSHIEIMQPKPMSVGWVIRLGVPVFVTDVNDELLKAASQDQEHLQVLKQLDITSAMIVPMPYKGKNIGAVTFLCSDEHKRYDKSDLSFAKDLGIRIGVALENNRLFDAARRELSLRIRQQMQTI